MTHIFTSNEKLTKSQTSKMVYAALQNNFVVGIDVGHSTVTAALGQLAPDGKVRILSIGTSGKLHTGLENNELTNPKNASIAIGYALDDLRSKIEGVEIDEFTSVVVNISGAIASKLFQHSKTVAAKNKEVSIYDLHTMRNDMYGSYENNFLQAGEKPLHVVAQNYMIDDRQTEVPIGTVGAMIKTNFLLVLSSQKDIDRAKRAIDYCELAIDQYIATPIASADAVLSPQEKEDGVALIDIGAQNTCISIYTKGRLRYATILKLGGELITEDLRQGLNISVNTAENIKIKGGEAIQSKDIETITLTYEGSSGAPHQEVSANFVAGIIQSRLEEIMEYAHGEIKKSGCADQLYEGIVITGGTALTKKIQLLSEFKMAKKTRIGTPNQNLSNADDKRYRNPAYATAIGLVINEFNTLTEAQEIGTNNEQNKQKQENSNNSKPNFFDKIKGLTKIGKNMLIDPEDDI